MTAVLAPSLYASEPETPEAEDSFVLVQERVPKAVIVTAQQPGESTAEAVRELNYWIKRITGTELPVMTVDSWDRKSPYIAVGSSWLTQENGWDQGKFDQEEARVFIEPAKIGLLGNDRAPYPEVYWSGTYYAVLEFLRKSLDVRWIFPGELGEVYTLRQTLEVAPGKWAWVPDLRLMREMRNGYGTPWTEGLASRLTKEYFDIELWDESRAALSEGQELWLKRQRMNRSSNARFGHAFSKWWEKYAETHPEWFAKPPEGVTQRGGHGVKLNLSNPEVQEKIIADWKSEWQREPLANKFLNVAPNDSRGFDTRPETRAWDAPEMQKFSDKDIWASDTAVLSDRYAKFWNILAKQVRETDPEAYISTYAYRNYRKPPLGDVQLENNIIIGYVGAEGYYPDERFILDEWKDWAGRGAQMFWRPNVLHCGHGIPYLYSRQIFEDFQEFRKNHLMGTSFDSLTGNWAGQGLTYYILAELHSRPEATYEELANEYFSAFGPAQNAISEYYAYFEDLTTQVGPKLLRERRFVPHETWGGWWKGHIRLVPAILTPEVLDKAEAFLNGAEDEVRDAPEVYQKRVALVRRGFDHMKLMAETFRKLKLDDPDAKVSYAASREVLQPLWDFRQSIGSDYAVSAASLTMNEHRQLGIWEAFTVKAEPEQALVIPLSENWTFRLDPSVRGLKEAWQDLDGKDWSPVAVGSPWRRVLPEVEESRVGWYRVSFEVPELADTGERVFLQFSSVDAEVKIWVNGVLVNERGYPHDGNYDSWSAPFEVDVTNAVRQGPGNSLVLRVESQSKNAGITGPVFMKIAP